MKQFVVMIGLIMLCIWGLNCDDSGDKVIGSRDHDIKSAQSTLPTILANGIATAEISATVLNKNKTVAPNMKVHFKTSHGSIEEFAITDNNGIARATLTSEASETDITAEITATVVDTMFTPLNKNIATPLTITLNADGFENEKRAVRKTESGQENRATVYVKFLGVTLNAEIEETILPADGVSETKINIRLRETTSLKVIKNAEIHFLLTYGTVPSTVVTDDQGNSIATLKAAKKAALDTLVIEYGNKITKRQGINYVTPKFELNPKKARIPADGISKVQMVATLLTQQNTPIVGAKVKFSATAGVIFESAFTDNYGQARVDLVAGTRPDSLVKVTAKFLSQSDTATISFGSIDVKTIAILGDTDPVLRTGKSAKQLELIAKNTLGLPVADVVINLRTNIGTVPTTTVTNQQGKATFQFTADAGSSDAIATITASVGTVQATHNVHLLGISMIVTANPASILADGTSTSSIRVELKQTTSHLAVSGQALTFAVELGTMATNASTDNQGVASITYTASSVPGMANVTVTCGALISTVKVALLTNYPKNISLTADSEPILRDGIASKQLNLKATNELGQPVANVAVNITANLGTVPGSAITDQQGFATVKYTADAGNSDATATIAASVGTIQASQTVRLLGITMTVTANPTSILADGITTSAIRVEVKQTVSHIAVTNHPISFAADLGSIPTTASTDNQGIATITYTAGTSPGISTIKIACGLLKGEQKITLVANFPKSIELSADTNLIIRDGLATKSISVSTLNELGGAVANVVVNLQVNRGTVPATIMTDSQGKATFNYTADAGSSDATATITASAVTVQTTQTISLLGVKILLSATPDSISADGKSTSTVRVEVKQTTSNIAVAKHVIGFAANKGTIPTTVTTDDQGVATAIFTSSTQTGIATVTVTCGTLTQNITIYLFDNFPNSIILTAEPNFIWVKGTGHIQQSILTATVLGVTGQLIGNDYGIKFKIVNGPGGGEKIEPSAGSGLETTVIRTVNGKAEAKLLSGTISGTVQIRAELVDYPQVNAQTTNLVIRSGPPYMWLNPINANDVISHATLAIESGKHNVGFGNPIQEIKITGYFGDKYGNPVEEGTAVYFTTTGGYITSDAVTNNKGQATVILQNANPFPMLVSQDLNQLTALNIPNPNDDTLKLKINIPDFEGGLIFNSNGTFSENDGIALILAYSWGQDQNGKLIKVWTTGLVVYSVGVKIFSVECDATELGLGSSAIIRIRLYDYNGNPVAAGSSLSVTTTAGELSDTNLMPSAERYGYGQTYYQVTLMNNLDPTKDKETVAMVKIKLDSPNGTGTQNVSIKLKLTP